MTSLDSIFQELGFSQYLGIFVDQGFDTWDTILDITESDLDALGVKLGHRRKLQRRIANSRGLRPEVSLVSPTRASVEDGRLDANRGETAKPDGKEPGATKRKYRRHPKPDENAPERPPSAYVLFSNKMREDLKGRNLTFTEIAKLVGENWQSLSRGEKEPYETQAHDAKERYNRDLAEYKKTAEYRKYCDYLQDFRKRQAAQANEKDASKRLKTESSTDSNRGSSTSGTSNGASTTASGTGSGSDSQPGSEPPPSRLQRMESSTSEAQLPPPLMHNGIAYAHEETMQSPRLASLDINQRRTRGLSSSGSHDIPSPIQRNGRRTGWLDNQRMSGSGENTLPRLTQAGDSRIPMGFSAGSPEGSLPSLTSAHSQGSSSGRGSRSSGSLPAASHPPSLKTEQSSAGSMSSVSSFNPPRTPSDASLPIHALLSAKPEPPPYVTQTAQSPTNATLPPPHPSMVHPSPGLPPTSDQLHARHPPPVVNGFPPNVATPTNPHGLGRAQESPFAYGAEPTMRRGSKADGGVDMGLDGISALLKAREIVDRRPS